MSDLISNNLMAGAHKDTLFGIHDDALRFRARRMEVLASNIANADTPGYAAFVADAKVGLPSISTRQAPQAPCPEQPPLTEKTFRPRSTSSKPASGSPIGNGAYFRSRNPAPGWSEPPLTTT